MRFVFRTVNWSRWLLLVLLWLLLLLLLLVRSPLQNPIISYLKCIYFDAIHRILSVYFTRHLFGRIRSIDKINCQTIVILIQFHCISCRRTGQPMSAKNDWIMCTWCDRPKNQFLIVCLHFVFLFFFFHLIKFEIRTSVPDQFSLPLIMIQ